MERPNSSDLHVWLLDDDAARAALVDVADVLDADQRARVARLRFAEHRVRRTAAYAGLRVLLGAYLRQPPAEVPIARDRCPTCGLPHGKPELADQSTKPLHFSMSHAGEVVIYALATGPVGVDIEIDGRVRDPSSMLRLFHPDEEAAVRGLADDRRDAAFHRLWVRKEAYLKGLGVGLAGGLSRNRIGLGPGFGDAAPTAGEIGSWQLVDLPAPSGHVAAAATTGTLAPDVNYWPFDLAALGQMPTS